MIFGKKFLLNIIICSLVFFFGVITFSIHDYCNLLKISKEDFSVSLFMNKFENDSSFSSNLSDDSIINYDMVLEIPKIALTRGIFEIGSSFNNVDNNVTILDGSSMPNVSCGNLILAAHSGSASNAYFDDIDKLSVGDVLYVYYDSIKYFYKVFDYYYVDKNGYIDIIRDNNKSTLTLTTCSNDDNISQLVIICYLYDTSYY